MPETFRAPPSLVHSSLVLSLAADAPTRAAALAALQSRSDLELGRVSGRWVPALLSSFDPLGACRDIEAIDGVEHVEVVFVTLPETANAAPS